MSPDDNYQDLKRIIGASVAKAHRVNVIMPFLYESRQHKREKRESLDCAMALEELVNMGVKNIITFDAHDPRVQNSIPLNGFDSFMPTYAFVKAILQRFPDLQINKDTFMVISPDEGAMGRAVFLANNLGVDMGMFYKRRDYSKVVNGRNPIVAHEYLGEDVEGKDVFIVDDIIASGDSVLDIAYALKERKANKIYAYATYSIFTAGYEKIDKAYADGVLTGIFGTNLTYVSEETRAKPWFHEVDVSKYVAYIIAALNHNLSVTAIIDPHEKINALLKKHGLR
jgi:ribose-phosphate pyrophosphokinase